MRNAWLNTLQPFLIRCFTPISWVAMNDDLSKTYFRISIGYHNSLK